jgi:hypothetical protein
VDAVETLADWLAGRPVAASRACAMPHGG